MSTFNKRTLQKRASSIPELIASDEVTNQHIIYIQEYRIYHDDIIIKEEIHRNWKLITCSAWKNSINDSICRVGLLLNSRAFKSFLNIEKYNQE